jgi:hypothetical protein
MENEGPGRPLPDEGTVTVEAVALETTADRHWRLSLEDGSEQQIPAPAELAELLRPGMRVLLYFSPNRELLGWYLPEHKVGQDLRRP